MHVLKVYVTAMLLHLPIKLQCSNCCIFPFRLLITGWPLTWKTWKSQGIPKWSGKMEKVREKSGEVKSGVFFQFLNTPKLTPRTPLGELMMLPQTL